MLFNHYIAETEKSAITKACKRHDFDLAFNVYDHLGSYDYDRSCDLLALAVAGVKGTRRALLRGVTLGSSGGFYFSIPAQREANESVDSELTIESPEFRVTVSVPVLRDVSDAKRWISSLNGDEKYAAMDFIMQLYLAACSAYHDIGHYVEGVTCPEYPEWVAEERRKGA